MEAITQGKATEAGSQAITPLLLRPLGRNSTGTQAATGERMNMEVVAAFGAEGAFDPDATRTALARFGAPVLLLADEVDLGTPPRTTAEFAALFPNAELVVQTAAGHHPWLDDADEFVAATAAFLDG
jgi:proline iminopeptidase